MNAGDKRFFNFPLVLLADTVKDPRRGMGRIFSWVIADRAKSYPVDCDAALIRLAYAKARNTGVRIPPAVAKITYRYDFEHLAGMVNEAWGTAEEDGFMNTMREILDDYPVGLHSHERDALVQWDTLNGAARFFGVNRKALCHDDLIRHAEAAQNDCERHRARFGKLAPASLPFDYFMEVWRDHADKPDEMRMLRLVAAVRSLVGNKDVVGTTKDMIRARMIGAKTPAVAEVMARHDSIIRYETGELESRKRIDRLIRESDERRFFTRFGEGRRLYFSLTIQDHLRLACAIRAKKRRRASYDAARAMNR